MAEFPFLLAENVDSLSPLRPFREENFQEKPLAGSVTKTFADERLLASNLGISFSPSYRFGVAVNENSIVLTTYPSSRRKNFSQVS